jgi:segregation and condensation protein A
VPIGSGTDKPVTDEPQTAEDDAAAAWMMPDAEAVRPDQALVVGVDGFEGPLDLLLALARTHKIDLTQISIVALADQYLAFVEQARTLNLEIAADYLVMAAWLAYLKSRLLLPKEKDDSLEPGAEELAARLAFRLQRLQAMREAAASLMTRPRLGRGVFARGMPEGVRTVRETQWTAQIYDLLKAYAGQRTRTIKRIHVVKARTVWSIKEARMRLEQLVGASGGLWEQLDMFLEAYLPAEEQRATVKAASFGATLEMAREGLIELRQEAPFAPIYMRRREKDAQWEPLA